MNTDTHHSAGIMNTDTHHSAGIMNTDTHHSAGIMNIDTHHSAKGSFEIRTNFPDSNSSWHMRTWHMGDRLGCPLPARDGVIKYRVKENVSIRV